MKDLGTYLQKKGSFSVVKRSLGIIWFSQAHKISVVDSCRYNVCS